MSPDHLEEMKRRMARIAEASQSMTLAYFEAEWEAKCQRILASANVPPFGHYVCLHTDGTWTDDLPTDWLQRVGDLLGSSAIVDPLTLIERQDGVGSQTWNAYRIVQRLHWLHQARATQDHERALESLFDLMRAVFTAILDMGLEADAQWGRNMRAGGDKGRKRWEELHRAEVKKKHDQWQQLAEQIWATSPTLSKLEVARRVSRRTGDPVHTIRQSIKHPSEKS